ncbi:hypothetical protein M3Y98_00673600 [Aphelenchoides besseyi]|nr:hypothetical protein M3Y98_00673600 [Aphelenchoides besseyi]
MEVEKSVVAKPQVPNQTDGCISAPATPHSSSNLAARTLTVLSQSRKRRATDEMAVDLPQMLKLVRSNGTDPKTPLERLEKQICCRFNYETMGWNEFRINMFGTDVGLRKGHERLTQMIQKPPISDPTGIFPFMSLPLEVQCMIVNHVDCKQPDGRPLLPLRLVNQHFRTLVERVMEKGRRCFKKRICLAETTNAKVRLGFPPLISHVSVSFEQLDSLLLKITSDNSNNTSKTQIFLICEWRSDWCKKVMELLLKHNHIRPSVLHIKGVICDEKPFKNYVNARPSLQRLVFEKPVGRKHVFNGVQYLPYHSIVFKDLGRQYDSPESIERLQLEREVFKSTGRAIELFTVYLRVPFELEESRSALKWGIRYDSRERVQVVHVDPSGLAAVHLKAGDIIREVNDRPIASKAMLHHWICAAIEGGDLVRMSIERPVGGDEAVREQFETPTDVLEIAQKQIQEIRAGRLLPTQPAIKRSDSRVSSTVTIDDRPREQEIQSDHDVTKLKSCKGNKN